ncbi:hypothetical protein C1Y40_05531 [Mycobacterium talmoniae]|uniref:Uncharacterized protein n=1 Tax=Mycobacterium talmoniae TaxID=1858794 RepID=A0A2S8BCD4_9MYCO|nr:hypothetical protein C1Y40_05531 [Mycobacterium talmoniae]
MRCTSSTRPARAHAQLVATAAHTVASGSASEAHSVGPASIAAATSPEKNANDNSRAVTRPRTGSETTHAWVAANASRAGSTRPQTQNRLAAR